MVHEPVSRPGGSRRPQTTLRRLLFDRQRRADRRVALLGELERGDALLELGNLCETAPVAFVLPLTLCWPWRTSTDAPLTGSPASDTETFSLVLLPCLSFAGEVV